MSNKNVLFHSCCDNGGWDETKMKFFPKNAEKINNNERNYRNERTSVLMDSEIGEEQGMSNNTIYLKLNGFHHEQGMLKYNNIDKPPWNIMNIDKMSWNQESFFGDNKMPPKIRNLDRTKIRVKQLDSLNIIKLDRVKQNYTENNIVKRNTCWICKNNLPTFDWITQQS